MNGINTRGFMEANTERAVIEILRRIEPLLPKSEEDIDWSAPAFRWRKKRYLGIEVGELEPIGQVAYVEAENLLNIDEQKKRLFANTEQFVKGFPANNILLTGARGTGKSSLIRAALTAFYKDGLRLIEVDKHDLGDLGEITALVGKRPEKFLIFCDDLSFEVGESGYKALKAALDGSAAASGDNMLIYATSNRRHLLPERMEDNVSSHLDEKGDLHPAETIEEQLSLSERFGIWLSFYPYTQDEYLRIAEGWTIALGGKTDENWRGEALRFALHRGSRSGRIAHQFARDWVGRCALKEIE